jgi:adenine-specific DNA-methyltransferase
VNVAEWREAWNRRLRPFIMHADARDLYREIAGRGDTRRFGELAAVGIGYVSGANEFFHLRPSEADKFDIPRQFLLASVRNGRALSSSRLTKGMVERWKRNDDPILLLRISKTAEVPRSVRRYLETDAAHVGDESHGRIWQRTTRRIPDHRKHLSDRH